MCRSMLKDSAIIACVLVYLLVRLAIGFPPSSWKVVRRSLGPADEYGAPESRYLTCDDPLIRSEPGAYTYVSDGVKRLCSLYVAAPVDHVVEIEFVYLDVSCEEDGAVVLLDGWELDHEIFPSPNDHPQPMTARYLPFCGQMTPTEVYTTGQNIAQLHFVVPTLGEGFTIVLNFLVNPKPCNMMLLTNKYDKIQLTNFGLRRNCTVMSLYPQRVQLSYVSVGEREPNDEFDTSAGLRSLCSSEGGLDRVQLYQGTGVGSLGRRLVLEFCGVRQTSAPRAVKLRCHSSAIRLESSGLFDNVIKFDFLPAERDDGIFC
ncbi:unnamed protein product [Lymnaea stagnalis]|uniref:Corticotropin-releasing factor-binding protein n=1 Tax=Lymnaea stagnalis TaxID=6523 RepID=A0AAV2I975_LYMST